MSGKGSTQRPQAVDDETMKENWRRIFGTDDKPAQADQREQDDGQ